MSQCWLPVDDEHPRLEIIPGSRRSIKGTIQIGLHFRMQLSHHLVLPNLFGLWHGQRALLPDPPAETPLAITGAQAPISNKGIGIIIHQSVCHHCC